MHKRELKKYFKEVEERLPMSARDKAPIIHNLRSGVAEFLELRPNAELEDVIARFGQPSDFEREALENMQPDEVHRRLTFTKRAKRRWVIVTALLILLILIGAFIWGLVKNIEAELNASQYFTIFITEEKITETDL